MEILNVTHDSRKVLIVLSAKGITKTLILRICTDEPPTFRDCLLMDNNDIDGDFVLDDNFKQLF